MILRSIKWRLQIWHGLILVLVLSGFGYTAFELQRTRETRRVDQELQDRMGVIFSPLRRPGRPPPGMRGPFPRGEFERPAGENPQRQGEEPPRGRPPLSAAEEQILESAFPEEGPFYYAVWDRSDRLLRSRALRSEITPPERPAKPVILQRGEYRELTQVTPRGELVLIGRSMQPELQEMRKLALILVASGAGILALGLVGGWMVATRAMRPINQISTTAQKIAIGDLSQRIAHEENESELGRLVAVLNSTFARLESAFGEQVRFTTDVSHELRTPVSVIVSQTQMALGRDRSATEYRESLEACQRAAQRMRKLIESLLQLARLDAGQEVITAQPFDLAAVVKECAELLRSVAEERRIALELNLTPAQATGDPDKIGQVVTNLLSNALQYTPAEGKVSIACRTENELAVVSITDTGIGIPAEDLPHIFDRFYRVDQSRARDKGGSGLGLAITRAIVHAHGGTIDVASDAGKGSTFTVRLPHS